MPTCDSCGVEFQSDKDIYGDIIVYIIYGILTLGLYLVLRPQLPPGNSERLAQLANEIDTLYPPQGVRGDFSLDE